MKASSITLLFSGFIFTAASVCLTSCKKEKNATPDNVESVVLIADREMGYGGYYYDIYKPWVLFKNGKFIKEPKVPLDEIQFDVLTGDIASSWGDYSYSGSNEISLVYSDGYTQKKRIGSKASPANPNESLNGHFSSISGGGNLAWGGSVGILSYARMSFTEDGYYTTERITGSNSSSHAAYNTNTTSGKYKFDGSYSITLTANNGETKRFFFCWFSGSAWHFRLAGRTFSRNSN